MTTRAPGKVRGWFTIGVYQVVFVVGAMVYVPMTLLRRTKRWSSGKFLERTGRVAGAATEPTGPSGTVWMHGVSVGEVKAAANILRRLAQTVPGLRLVISTTTPTGRSVAEQDHPDLPVFYYPLDFGRFPGRALDRVKPRLVLLMELEFWPNFLRAAAKRGIPVAVINGRISERTFRGYRRARWLLPQLDLMADYCVQDEVYAGRLLSLGLDPDRIHVTGNMKYDSVMLERSSELAARLRGWLSADGRLVLVCGSTHGEEDRVLADALAETVAQRNAAGTATERLGPVRLVLVPRHPERAGLVCDDLVAGGYQPLRLSELAVNPIDETPDPLPEEAVVVVDTIGCLQDFYAACDVAFVGGSLIPHGGQNMLEPAALGKAVVFGPSVSNFETDVRLLLSADACTQVRSAAELPAVFFALLSDQGERLAMGARAVEVIRANQGATDRTLEILEQRFALSDPAPTSGAHRRD